jgi:hypothetical protein
MELSEIQKNLALELIDFDLEKFWNSHLLIELLRTELAPAISELSEKSDIPFDPQDLEHQSLFFLTTFNPGAITRKIISETVEQQYLIIRKRLLSNATEDELQYLFRGLKKFYPDLNIHHRLKLKWENGNLIAVGDGRRFDVEFKKITDEKMIKLFTDTFHYIHQSRIQGDTFALFFKGDRYPWAIETTECSIHSRPYKRKALLAHGFHPDKGIELTRLYTLPGSPLNAISIFDGLVRDFYKHSDIQVLFTKTMPSYSKSKSTTIAGGLNKVLCVNELKHDFVRVQVEGIHCWENVSRRWLENNPSETFINSNDGFGLYPALDVFMALNNRSIPAIPELCKNNKAIYFNRNTMESCNFIL